ncbi:hypothetical protein SNE40_014674 [Patella caerulea]|uniref:G-protein coupled receptors family 1 profile domain-containing protein n=1 Tax=Patella caerulea TaxID=87958 RepID=A0AAN8JKJ2_PATCE
MDPQNSTTITEWPVTTVTEETIRPTDNGSRNATVFLTPNTTLTSIIEETTMDSEHKQLNRTNSFTFNFTDIWNTSEPYFKNNSLYDEDYYYHSINNVTLPWFQSGISDVTNYSNSTHSYAGWTFSDFFPPTFTDTHLPSNNSEVVKEALILKTVSLVLIALSGIFANGFITYSVVRDRNLHKPPFYYLLSFCVSDLSRALFCIPLVLTSVLQGSVWKYGGAACKLFAFANSFFVYSSCMVLLAIAVDRHFSLVHVKFYKKRSRGLINLISVIIGWTVAFAMSFPPVLGMGTYVFIPEEGQCTFYHRYYRNNDTLGFMLVFTVILLLALFLYLRIFAFLRDHRRMRPLELQPARSCNWNFFGPGANGQAMINWVNGFGGPHLNPITNPNNPNVPRNIQRPNIGRVVNLQIIKNEHLTRLFFIVTVVFAILWTPYTIMGYWRIFGNANSIPSFLITVSAWLTYAQIALCPLVYVVSRGPIRKSSRTIYNNQDKKEFLLEARNRK